ncbi:MAG: IPT/TIG domain-containing protein [Patescibacteria group bacterium]|nr:IPT/TIG domain-containing protein [Patescibacteria group bacterium]
MKALGWVIAVLVVIAAAILITNARSVPSSEQTNVTTVVPSGTPVSHPQSVSTSTSPSPAATKPAITKLSPESGKAGTTIVITGAGFDPASNMILFGTGNGRTHPDGSPDNRIADTASKDGTTLTFTVPSSGPSGILCDAKNNCIAIAALLLQPGTYPVQVTNGNGTSNTVEFTLTK